MAGRDDRRENVFEMMRITYSLNNHFRSLLVDKASIFHGSYQDKLHHYSIDQDLDRIEHHGNQHHNHH